MKMGKVARAPRPKKSFGFIDYVIQGRQISVYFSQQDVEPASLPLKTGDAVLFLLVADAVGLRGIDVRKVKHISKESVDAEA